uniref:Uncharacterized protein n=1 Tax=Tanacetum cinerariifolium TaxID=118510 RepID=A0A6L2KIG5_TANCI|nr:hypothetical protein [Tanacetum cinerariifolium]
MPSVSTYGVHVYLILPSPSVLKIHLLLYSSKENKHYQRDGGILNMSKKSPGGLAGKPYVDANLFGFLATSVL